MQAPRAALRSRFALLPAILLLALWLPGASQGAYRVDTGLYAAVSLHAWREGPLWPLMAGDQPYFNKPPVVFWIHGLFLHALGTELWVARLPSLLAAVACASLLFAIARPLSGPRVARLAACILALTPEFFRATKSISLDLWITMFLLVSVLCVTRAHAMQAQHLGRTRSVNPLRRILFAGGSLALALLAKPVVPLLAVPALSLWIAALDGRAASRRILWPIIAAAIAMLLAAAWYVPMYLRFGQPFIDHHFARQMLDRATGEQFGPDPWWYYAALFARTYWPWLPFALLAAIAAIRTTARDRRALALCLIWTAAWLIALSLVAGKSHRYAIPVYPFLAWLSAHWLIHHAPRTVAIVRRAAQRWIAPIAASVAGLALILNLRIHAPAPPHWEALYQFARERPAEAVAAPPEFLWSSANVYLHTGLWPRTLPPTTPLDSTTVLLLRDSLSAPPGSVEVWRSGPMFAVKAAAP